MGIILKKIGVMGSWLLLCTSCNRINADYKELTRIEIHFMNSEILTPFSVDCDAFEVLFESRYKTLIIKDSNEIHKIKKCLRKSKKLNIDDGIDVRIKVYLYNNEKQSSVICYDQFGNLKLNSKEYLKNDCFVNLINKKIEQITK